MKQPELRDAVTQFLAMESALLDGGRFEEWFDLLDDDLSYEVPIRLSADRREDEMAAGGYRLQDTKEHVRVRIKRLASGNAYAEMPPSRTVRSVSLIYIAGAADGIVDVSSALIVYRHRGDDALGDTIHARREDRLRILPDGPRLLSRRVILASVVLPTANLGIFL